MMNEAPFMLIYKEIDKVDISKISIVNQNTSNEFP